jgi:hypothetical protein
MEYPDYSIAVFLFSVKHHASSRHKACFNSLARISLNVPAPWRYFAQHPGIWMLDCRLCVKIFKSIVSTDP